MKEGTEKWARYAATGEDWTKQLGGEEEEGKGEQSLKKLKCPGCDNEIYVGDKILRTVKQYSNLRCAHCKLTKAADHWKCPCGQRWPKCELHYRAEGTKLSMPMKMMRPQYQS